MARRAGERDHLPWLVHTAPRIQRAEGAWLKRHGRHKLFKRPVWAGRFVLRQGVPRGPGRDRQPHHAALGHTRQRTCGDEKINENNRPIWAGDILGTHNGTIYNANYLFRRSRLHRFAEVDSELLFRLAARAGRNGRIDVERFKARLKLCRGQMASVMTSRRDPETTLVLKGNKPLELRIHRRHRVILYASDAAYLDAVLDDERGWHELPVPPMSLMAFRHRDLMDCSMEPFEFVAQAKRRKKPALAEIIDDWERTVHGTG